MKKRERWHPPEQDESGFPNTYAIADIQAIQTLAAYARLAVEAWDEKAKGAPPPPPSPFQVKLALDWIIMKAAMTYDEPFIAGQPDATNYLLGRRSVGLAIIKLMTVKPSIFDKEKE